MPCFGSRAGEGDALEGNETLASKDMVAFCFDVLERKLNKQSPPAVYDSIPNERFPLFVTWKKGPSHRLRGCIGTFAELSLHEGLRDYALTSALRDSRFSPIELAEVPQLHCGVSLLIRFEPARDYTDWVVGVHGIRIHYMDGQRRRDAVYLPEVAHEQGWNHVETIDNLIEKGGYRGPIDEAFRRAVQVTRFQSSKAILSYQEYIAHQKSHGRSA